MTRKSRFIMFFILYFLSILIVNVLANHGEPHDIPTTAETGSFDSRNFDTSTQTANPGADIPPNTRGEVKMKGTGSIKFGETIFELNDGDTLFIDNDDNPSVRRANRIKTTDKATGEETVAEDVEDGKINQDGSFEFKSVKTLKKGKTTIINGKGVKFKNGILSAEKADSFINDKSVTININNLESVGDIYSVESADSFLSDCIRVDNIKDSEFKVSDKIYITTKSNVNLKITDCSYNEVEFNGKGKVSVDKSSNNPKYTLENGSLTKKEKNYNETVESNNSIIIETDKTFGFKCLTITPVGSYFYNDKDLRKDFIINIPKESSIYKLCLRKNSIQNFQTYNGLVDFVDKKIELNGIANYLRYSLKRNQIVSLLSDFVYRGLKNVKTILTYDDNLLFLNNVEIKNVLQSKQQITVTKPNNYYNIKEIQLEDGKIHRVVELNIINKNQLTQDINYNYESDSLVPKINIKNNVLVQSNGKNSITILPPGNERINEVLK